MSRLRRLAYGLAGHHGGSVTVKFEDGTTVEMGLVEGFRFMSTLGREGYEIVDEPQAPAEDHGDTPKP